MSVAGCCGIENNRPRVTLYSWNVNGVRAAVRKGFLDWFRRSEADIVAIQETRAAPEQISPLLLHPLGYHSDWYASAIKGYSGVATVSRGRPVRVIRGSGEGHVDCEGRVLISEFARFVVINVYAPNGGRGPAWVEAKLALYRHLLMIVKQYMANNLPVILAGDFNTAYAPIDLARPTENMHHTGFLPEERESLGQFFAAGMGDTFRLLHPHEAKYSYWDQRTNARARNCGWRLDYILISPTLKSSIVAADICTAVQGSDHCPVSLTFTVP